MAVRGATIRRIMQLVCLAIFLLTVVEGSWAKTSKGKKKSRQPATARAAKKKPAAKKTAADKAKKKKKTKAKNPKEGWLVDQIVVREGKPTEKELGDTRFWNYVDGPEAKDDVTLKNGHVIFQVGYNVSYVDAVDQAKGPPLLIFKSSPCRGGCGGAHYYVLYNPARKDFLEFPLPAEGYIREEGEAKQDLSQHLWSKSSAYYGRCAGHAGRLLIYRQERECGKCPLIHQLRTISRRGRGAILSDLESEQGEEIPAKFKKVLGDIEKNIKKKRCKELAVL